MVYNILGMPSVFGNCYFEIKVASIKQKFIYKTKFLLWIINYCGKI